MAFSKYRGWKVRGFWDDDKTELVLVKGYRTRIIKVMSSKCAKGKCTFITPDGVKATLPKDKNKVRCIKNAKIVTDFVYVYDEAVYENVYGDYTKLNLEKNKYHVAYYNRCFFRKRFHISSPVKKIWKEQGKYHALTMAGAHYVFSIQT